MSSNRQRQSGFTLLELLLVIAIIGMLAVFVFTASDDARDQAQFTRAVQELYAIRQAMEFYHNEYGDYPPDTNRNIPPGLERYLAPNIWPNSAWPGSVYDWDRWTDPDDGSEIMQISVRFCPAGQPSQCVFPTADWADDFDVNSAVYFCLEGACRSHIDEPIDHPGYCVNC